MRSRSAWIIPTALISGLTLVIPGTAAQAVAPHAPASTVTARRASTVTLPTGEHLTLSGRPGRERVLVDHAGATGPGKTVVTRRMRSRTYVMPAVAEPYLGRFLDPELFDATSLQAQLTPDGRVPVRIAYRGSTPAVPGVHLTSASGGQARGYLTPGSSARFGAALTRQWETDSRAGFPQRSSLFGGVTRISAVHAVPRAATPAYRMYTLVIKTIGADGRPQPEGFLGLMNVDDGLRYTAFVVAEDGEARVSVPAGHYSAIGDDFRYDKRTQTGDLRVTTVNEFRVTGAGQTLTIDHRLATVHPSATVPQPTAVQDYVFDWDRTDATEDSSFDSGYFVDGSTTVGLAPQPKPAVGAVVVTHSWDLAQPGTTTPAYTYALAHLGHQVGRKPHYRYAAADLATVHASYYGDGSKPPAGFARIAEFPEADSSGGAYLLVPRGTKRTEYVGANGHPYWSDNGLVNADAWDDPGFVDGPVRLLPAGSARTIKWFRGPLAAGIPSQSAGGFCYGCRSGNTLEVGVAPFTDSKANHVGEIFGAEDGLPVARFRFYKNGRLVSDEDDSLGGSFTVGAAPATYTAVADVDRRLSAPAQSTQSHTELTFSSARGAGKKLPGSWYCDGASCRVLPILQARLGLPTDLHGRLPVGRSTVTVTAAQVQKAATSPITSATLEFRPAGSPWQAVPLTSVGGGVYRGVLDNPAEVSGLDVDVRMTAADRAGSRFEQTVLRAYTVAATR